MRSVPMWFTVTEPLAGAAKTCGAGRQSYRTHHPGEESQPAPATPPTTASARARATTKLTTLAKGVQSRASKRSLTSRRRAPVKLAISASDKTPWTWRAATISCASSARLTCVCSTALGWSSCEATSPSSLSGSTPESSLKYVTPRLPSDGAPGARTVCPGVGTK